MHIPNHVHPKDIWWWARLVPYVGLTILLLLVCFGVTSNYFMYLTGVYAVFRLFLWVRSGFQCMHCLFRLFLASSIVGLLYLHLPLQYLIAALLIVWADYLLRFGHQFITEDAHEVGKLKK